MTDCKDSGDGRCVFCKSQMPAVGVRRNCVRLIADGVVIAQTITLPRIAFGDIVEQVLVRCGVTKELVSRMTRIKDCGCEFRKRWLNNAGYRATAAVEAALNSLVRLYLWE